MADVLVTPRARRASWAKAKTEYDADEEIVAAPPPLELGARRTVILEVEVDRTSTLDSLLEGLERRDGVKILRVIE